MKSHGDRLLFAAHGGTYCGRLASVIMDNTALPIATGERQDEAPFGIEACWSALGDVVEFFEALGIQAVETSEDDRTPGGLWVFECEPYDDATAEAYSELDVDDGENPWGHLAHGLLRRPTADELSRMADGECPWPAGSVL